PDLTPSERIRIGLALLPSDPSVGNDLAKLLLDARPREVAAICDGLSHVERVPPLLSDVVSQGPLPPEVPDSEHDRAARGVANAAIALARLGKDDVLWQLLKSGTDNSVRSYIISRWGSCGGEVGILVHHLTDSSSSADEFRAIVLALGSLPEGTLDA